MSYNSTNYQAILLISNKDSSVIELQYQAIKNIAENISDVLITYHQKEVIIPSFIEKVDHFIFINTVFNEIGFSAISANLIPGNNHFHYSNSIGKTLIMSIIGLLRMMLGLMAIGFYLYTNSFNRRYCAY